MKRRSLLGDRRGSADLIQFVLVLPIFVLILYGSFEIWKIVSVRQSLGAATFQAARCRSIYSACNGVRRLSDDDFNCEWVLLNELADNSFIDWEDLVGAEIRYRDERGNVICVVTLAQIMSNGIDPCPNGPTTLGRNAKFSAEAELLLPWSILIPGLSLEGSDAVENPSLLARHRSYIHCGPQWEPEPTATPTP
jgi:hypothetical protein